MSIELAVAYVSIVPETSKLESGLKEALNRAGRDATVVGRDIGRKVSDGASAGFSGGGMSKALAQELGSAGDKASKELLRSLAVGHRQAEQNAAVAGRNYASAMASAMGGGSRVAAQKFEAEFRNALNAKASSQHFFDEFHRDGVRRGQQVGTLIGKTVGGAISLGIKGAAVAAGGAVAAVGFTLVKGFQRLEKIDSAKFKLQALGHSAEETKSIMDSALASVQGTAFALDEAATSAASAVAAGIKPGQQLTQYLKDIADAAAIAGTGFDEMGHIFNKIQTQNKAYTDDLQMLSDRGVPIFQWLQQEYGVTGDALSKMVEKGQVDAAHFEKAIEDHIGGSALKMGQSFSGAVDNMQTAVARVGADFLTAIFGDSNGNALTGPTAAIDTITGKLNELDGWVKSHQVDIKKFFEGAVNAAKDLATAVGSVLSFLKEHPAAIKAAVGAFVAWEGIKGVAALSTALTAISTLLKVTLPASAVAGAAGITSALGPVAALAAGIYAATGGRPQDNVGLGPNSPGNAAKNGDWGSAIFGDAWPTIKGMLPGGDSSPPGVPSSYLAPGDTQGRGGGRQAEHEGRPLGQPNPSVGGHPGPPQTGSGGNSLPGAASYGLPRGSNSGGYGGNGVQFPDWVNQISQAFGIKPSTYPGHQETDRHEAGFAPNPQDLNRAIDWSGSPDALQKFADYLSTVPNGLEQVIWQNPNTGQRTGIAGGADVSGSGYYAGDYGGHTDHVHTRQSTAIPLPPWLQPKFAAGGPIAGSGGPTSDSVPIWASNGEHMLTASDVNAMGGQSGVYAFRNALHRAGGGSIELLDFIKQGSGGGGGGGDRGAAHGDVGKRSWWNTSDSPKKPGGSGEWGQGILRGPRHSPAGPHRGWLDRDWPWWMFPGDAPSVGTPGPDRDHRRDIIIGPQWKHPMDKRLPPGAYDPPAKAPRILPRPKDRAAWWDEPPEQTLSRQLGFADGGQISIDQLFRNALHRATGGDVGIGRGAGLTLDELPLFRGGLQQRVLHDQLVKSEIEYGLGLRARGMPQPAHTLHRAGGGSIEFADGGQIDINALLAALAGGQQHGLGQGAPPGPQDQGAKDQQGVPPGPGAPGAPGAPGTPLDQQGGAADAIAGGIDGPGSGRTPGFVPVGAGSTSVAGTSFLAGILNLGNEAAAGGIDIGAEAIKAGISAAAGAGSFGAGGGAAAGAVAGPLVDLGATQLKRGVSYGFQMLSILGDSAIEQIFGPLGGPPRWLGYDYTQFVPHINFGQFGASTLEKALQAGQGGGGPGQEPGGPVDPSHLPGQQNAGPPVPKFGTPPPQLSTGPNPDLPLQQPGITTGVGMGAGMGLRPGPAAPGGPIPPGAGPAAPPPPAPGGMAGVQAKTPPLPPHHNQNDDPKNPLNWFSFDNGGFLEPGMVGINQTKRPEPVFTAAQFDKMAPAPQGNGRGDTHWHVTVADMDELHGRVDRQRKLEMLRYSGRP